MSASRDDDTVTQILEVLARLTRSEFSARAPVDDGDGALPRIAAAVNHLAATLQESAAALDALTRRLEREVATRGMEIDALARANEQIARSNAAVRELSTPVIEVMDGVLVIPLIGAIDPERGEQLLERVLSAIARTGARVAIVDLTGVYEINAIVAEQLQRLLAAARLLGARTLLTGMTPAVARAMIELRLDLQAFAAESTLKSGLRRASAMIEAR
ncbi:MAG: STAS domain-containing protein [Myxococcales bacterium]|nr:STAS domain-containing protein [Myxococcales bacterium]